MSLDHRELTAMKERLEAFRKDIPAFMEQLAVGEGVYAAGQAKRVCKEDGIVNTGNYRENWHAGSKAMAAGGGAVHDGARPRRGGCSYTIDVYNNAAYASELEYGFRSHFVPGYWAGKTFVYQPGFPGGMYVGPKGGYQPGHYTLMRALRRTRDTQAARLQRKTDRKLREVMDG